MSKGLALLTAIIVIGLAVAAFLMGVGLVPSQADAIQKNTLAPWRIVWGMVGVTIVCAGALAVFLFNYAMKGTGGRT
jgi:drug/metabolite transporter (DMT)-like permease